MQSATLPRLLLTRCQAASRRPVAARSLTNAPNGLLDCGKFMLRTYASPAFDGRRSLCAAAADSAAAASSTAQPSAAYVHLPFCKRKCSYCDFPVIAVGMEGAASEKVADHVAAYTEMLLREIRASRRLNDRPLQTVFFGGGTPSLLPLPLLEELLRQLDASFGIAPGAEVCIEADPGTFDAARLRSYLDLGVTRISMGVQAFQDELLSLCGRAHDVADVYRALEAVHAAGVPSWSLDLMSGLPNLTEGAWEDSLAKALDAGPHHVSVYDLQVEEGTPFARRYSPGRAPLPSDEAAARMYCTARSVLCGAGYEHYEVSNYALPGHRCAHNMAYWTGAQYYAFGMGAASYLQGRRYSRPKRLGAYRTWLEQYAQAGGRTSVAGEELPPELADDVLLDTVMLRLRLADGLDLDSLAAAHPQGSDAADLIMASLAPSLAAGLAQRLPAASRAPSAASGAMEAEPGSPAEAAAGEGTADQQYGVVRLSDPEGFLLSNDIISDVFAAFELGPQDD